MRHLSSGWIRHIGEQGDYGPALGAAVGSSEEVVLASERDGPDGALDGVGVELDVAVVEEAAARSAAQGRRRIMLGADKAYDVAAFVEMLRSRSVTLHITVDGHRRNDTGKPRRTAVDGRTLRHAGYAINQRCRKRIEEVFGWIKSFAGLAKIKLRGRVRVAPPSPWPLPPKISSVCPSS